MFSRLCYATLFLLTAVPLLSAAESSLIPKRFSTSIGGFLGSSYQLELHDGILTYTASGGGHTNPRRITIKPTTAQWREFRQALDELKVWQWHLDYPNQGTVDGTQWFLEITYADRAIKTHGDNSYPGSGGKPSRELEATVFKGYLDAVKKLIDGKTFQ